ncbi:large ribosomal subunit protein uL15m-like [Convolutriloba macropyga]|uniref:large ribosomal subunit protein uL15m-like n=1 Tax=Convolutriloba macropyga TaxID=536237 RepID=UPI003F522BE1
MIKGDFVQRAASVIRNSPRITLETLSNIPVEKKPKPIVVKYKRGNRLKWRNFPPLGHVDGRTPLNIRTPKYPYYKHQESRLEYFPLSLFRLQNMIDMGVINANKPLDFGKIAMANVIDKDLLPDMSGIQLTREGVEYFKTPVNIEVQHIESDEVIAAIERIGGSIVSAYYDENALTCLRNPLKFFSKSLPIPPRLLPPIELIEYYTDPSHRGYLCSEEEINNAKKVLADKIGYESGPDSNFACTKKGPRQIFFFLDPGMVINLKDKIVAQFQFNDEYKSAYNKGIIV